MNVLPMSQIPLSLGELKKRFVHLNTNSQFFDMVHVNNEEWDSVREDDYHLYRSIQAYGEGFFDVLRRAKRLYGVPYHQLQDQMDVILRDMFRESTYGWCVELRRDRSAYGHGDKWSITLRDLTKHPVLLPEIWNAWSSETPTQDDLYFEEAVSRINSYLKQFDTRLKFYIPENRIRVKPKPVPRSVLKEQKATRDKLMFDTYQSRHWDYWDGIKYLAKHHKLSWVTIERILDAQLKIWSDARRQQGLSYVKKLREGNVYFYGVYLPPLQRIDNHRYDILCAIRKAWIV